MKISACQITEGFTVINPNSHECLASLDQETNSFQTFNCKFKTSMLTELTYSCQDIWQFKFKLSAYGTRRSHVIMTVSNSAGISQSHIWYNKNVQSVLILLEKYRPPTRYQEVVSKWSDITNSDLLFCMKYLSSWQCQSVEHSLWSLKLFMFLSLSFYTHLKLTHISRSENERVLSVIE